MRDASRSLIAAAVLWGAASASFGLGFGRTTANTVLGQPLDFVVVLRQDPDEFVDAECVEAEVVAGDEKLGKQQLRVALEGPAGAAERTLRVTSSVGIAEPVVSITLGVGCPVRLSRNFVAFIDPPSIQLAQQADAPAAATLPATASPAPVASDAAPAASPLPPVRRSAAPPRRSTQRRATPAPGETTIAAAATDAKPATAPRRPAAATQQRARSAAKPPSGARLVLEAAPASSPARVAAVEADKAAAAAALATTAATAAAEAASAAAANEAQRGRALEEALQRLKAQTQKANDELAALRRRVQQAEADQYANPMVYGLGALAALLALLLLALLWRRSREQDARWWADAASARADAATPSRRDPDSVSGDSRLGAAALPVVIERLPPATPARALNAAALVAPETRPAVSEPRRAVSVEELIDLEQQAEFFAVLGQHDQAIDLLMNHLRGTGGISPLPYLKLLDIYRRRGDREPYERMRERFNRRFNAYAPEWDADPAASRSLDSYPEVMQRIVAAWPNPQQAMDELEALLFRRDEGETFDVPAYGELLFLYSLARDSYGQPEVAAALPVDIMLPLDVAPPPMVSTISLDAKPEAERPLALDLELVDEPETAITASASSRERAERYEDGDFSFRTEVGDKLKRR